MLNPFKLFSSTSPGDEEAPSPIAGFKHPRKPHKHHHKAQEPKATSAVNLDPDHESPSASATVSGSLTISDDLRLQSESHQTGGHVEVTPSSHRSVHRDVESHDDQDVDSKNESSRAGAIRGAEQSLVVTGETETIDYDLRSDAGKPVVADKKTVTSVVEQGDHVTYVTTTTTDVKEERSREVKTLEKPPRSMQPRRRVPKISRPVTDSLTHSPGATRTGTMAVRSTYSLGEEYVDQLGQLQKEESDRIRTLIMAEQEKCQVFYEEQLSQLQTENKRLLQEATQLQIRLKYRDPELQYDNKDSTITTDITTITVTITKTITTVITRVEEWKARLSAGNEGRITILTNELEQLWSDLSTTSLRMAELQQRYTELSEVHGSIRHQLQVALSGSDKKERILASLTAEVAQWRNTDTLRMQEITALQGENENLQADIDAASAREAEVRQRLNAQSRDLGALRRELQTKASSIEEMDRKIASINAEVDQLEESNAAKAQQIVVAHQEYERLHGDFTIISSQYTELQKRYDGQAKDVLSIRSDLGSRESLLLEKEHTITSLVDEVARAKQDSNVKTEQLEAARSDTEQLRAELSSANSRFADLQKRYEAQSQELNSVRDEVSTLYPEGMDQPSGKASKKEIADRIRRAVEQKDKQIAELRLDLATSTSQNAELQKSKEILSRDLSSTRDELKEKTSRYEGNITSLNVQVDRLKGADAAKAEQIGALLKQVEGFRQDLSVSASELTELHERYETQSRKFADVRSQLEARVLSEEGKDRTIASLTTQVGQLKDADASKAVQLTTTLEQLETLRHDASTSVSQLAGLQSSYDKQSRELTAVRDELRASISSGESKDRTIDSLKSKLQQLITADASSEEHVTVLVKQVETLQQELVISSSQLHDLKGLYDEQSHELITLHDELTSSHDTITSLTDELERTKSEKEEQLATSLEQIEKFKQDISVSASQLVELQSRYDEQSNILITIRKEIETTTSSYESKITIAIKQVEQLKQNLSTSETKLTELQSCYDEQSRDIIIVRSELETYESKVAQLQQDLSTSKSKFVELQGKYDEQLRELAGVRKQLETSILSIQSKDQKISSVIAELEVWKEADANEEKRIVISLQKIEQLEQDLSTSESKLAELQSRYDEQSSELIVVHTKLESSTSSYESKIEQYQQDISTSETKLAEFRNRHDELSHEITIVRNTLETTTSSYENKIAQLEHDLSTSESQLVDLQNHHGEQSHELAGVRDELEASTSLSKRKDETISSIVIELDQWKEVNTNEQKRATLALQRVEQLEQVISTSETKVAELQSRCDELESSTSSYESKVEQLQHSFVDLQSRYDEQLQELATIRDELETSISSGKTKDVTISSLTTELERWKEADVNEEKRVAIALQQVEQLKQDLSASKTKVAELQSRYDEQSHELTAARVGLESKIEQFRQDRSTFESKIAELQSRYNEQSHDLDAVRSELEISISSSKAKDQTISSITVELEQWKDKDAKDEQRIAVALQQATQLQQDLSISKTKVVELQQNLSTFKSQVVDIQNKYDEQSHELAMKRGELEASILASKRKDETIFSITVELEQWKEADADEEKRVGVALQQVEQLKQDLSVSESKLVELQNRYDEQSHEIKGVHVKLETSTSSYESKVEQLQRDISTSSSQFADLQNHYDKQSHELAAVRDELEVSISFIKSKDQTISSITGELEQWKDADADEEKRLAVALEQAEKLQQDLTTSTSQLADLQTRYNKQSRELSSVRSKLEISISSSESKVSTTLEEVEKLQQELTAATSQLADLQSRYDKQSRELTSLRNRPETNTYSESKVSITLKQVEKLQQELSISSSQLADLQTRYDTQSRELNDVRSQLETSTLSIESKDRMISSTTAELEQWRNVGTDGEKRLEVALKQAEKLRQDFSTSTSQFTDLQTRYNKQLRELNDVRNKLENSTTELKQWKATGLSTPEEVTVVLTQVERLQQNLSTSASQLAEIQKLYNKQSGDLTAQLEQWKDASVNQEERVAITLKQVEKLKLVLSTSVVQLAELQSHYDKQSRELEVIRNELRISTSSSESKIVLTVQEAERLRQDLSTSESRLADLQGRYDEQSHELDTIRKSSVVSEKADETIQEARRLQQDLSTSESRLADLQGRYDEQSRELDTLRKSSVVSEKFDETVVTRVKDYSAVMRLTTSVDEWLRADAKRAEELSRELERRNKENEELRQNLVLLREIYTHSTEIKEIFQSQTTEIHRYQEEKLASELKDRQAQLESVQRFVTTADVYADTMIIQMLQKLNAEVQQNTTYIAECIVENAEPPAETSTEEQMSAIQRISKYIGQKLADSLNGEDVALFLSIAFQAYLSYHLCGIISSWSIEKENSDLINAIYKRLQEKEAQTISGRWRSLTRTYITPTCLSNPGPIVKSTIAGLSDIMVAAGYATSTPAAETMLSPYEEKVSSIILIAGQFSKMIGEVVSGDFEAVAISPGKEFDAATMEEDTDGGSVTEVAAGQIVLCSTHLGLTKRMPLESGEKNTLMVMKAKVLFESFLDVPSD